MATHTTVSGHEIEYTAGPDVEADLNRLRALLADLKATEDDMVLVVYSPRNPIMDRNVMPGRGAVTAAVLDNPVYEVMTDLLFRKGLKAGDLEAMAAAHTLTVAETARRLGVNESAVRQAIHVGRLGAWVKNGRQYVDPRALATFALSPRGPKPKAVKAGANAPRNPLRNPPHVRARGAEGSWGAGARR